MSQKLRQVHKIVLGEIGEAAMTDGGSTTGTWTFPVKKPKGFLPIAASLESTEVWSAAASAVLGTAGTANAYVATAVVTALGAINATPGADMDLGIGADQDVLLTVTHATDFTAYTTGKIRAVLYCIDLNEEVQMFP